MHRFTATLILIAPLLIASGCRRDAAAEGGSPAITIFAAASTTDVIDAAARRFEAGYGVHVTCSFGGSSTLARQIKSGAPADVFLSADERWMDDLADAGVIDADSRIDLLGNRLVLIVPAGSTLDIAPARSFDLASALPGVDRVAVADPTHVPAGRYARQALESLGWWAALSPRLVPTLDVRAALRLVELGEADLGIVYATDAAASDRVETRGAFPPDTHDPIRYPIALCRDAAPGARRFIEFLRSDAVAAIFTKAGFDVLAGHGES